MNAEDQLNNPYRPKNLCVCLPEYHQQYSLVLSILYIPLHFLDNYKCNVIVRFNAKTQQHYGCLFICHVYFAS